MPELIAHDDQKAAALEERVAKTIFRGPVEFINYYNLGIINKKHKDVAALATEIVGTFKNVKERGGKLTYISLEEINVEEVLGQLHLWEAIIRVKRELTARLADETLSREEVVYLSTAGLLQQTTEGELERLGKERLPLRAEVLQGLHRKYSTVNDEERVAQGVYPFKVEDIANLDASFINEIHGLLPS